MWGGVNCTDIRFSWLFIVYSHNWYNPNAPVADVDNVDCVHRSTRPGLTVWFAVVNGVPAEKRVRQMALGCSTGVLRAHNRKCVCRVISLILMQPDTHFPFSTNTLPGCPSSLQSDTISITSHTAHTFSIFYKYGAGLSQLVVGQALNT